MKIIINRTKLLSISGLISALILFTFLTSTSFADPVVLPVNSKPFGQSYKEWAIDFSRWAYSIPFKINPVFNPAITNCALPQHGKVWFVATASTNATCAVPNGKAIFVHMGVYNDTYPCPVPLPPALPFEPLPGQSLEEFLTTDAKAVVEYYISQDIMPNELYIDGKPVVDNSMLPKYRLSTGLFNLTGDLSIKGTDPGKDPCVTGKRQQDVTEGWFAIIDGLKPGKHRFDFHHSQSGDIGNSMEVTIGNNKVKDD
jgi:hypothetical protein